MVSLDVVVEESVDVSLVDGVVCATVVAVLLTVGAVVVEGVVVDGKDVVVARVDSLVEADVFLGTDVVDVCSVRVDLTVDFIGLVVTIGVVDTVGCVVTVKIKYVNKESTLSSHSCLKLYP